MLNVFHFRMTTNPAVTAMKKAMSRAIIVTQRFASHAFINIMSR